MADREGEGGKECASSGGVRLITAFTTSLCARSAPRSSGRSTGVERGRLTFKTQSCREDEFRQTRVVLRTKLVKRHSSSMNQPLPTVLMRSVPSFVREKTGELQCATSVRRSFGTSTRTSCVFQSCTQQLLQPDTPCSDAEVEKARNGPRNSPRSRSRA